MKYKIAIFAFGKAWGGVEKLVAWLVRELTNDFDFTILTPTPKEECVIKNIKLITYKEGDTLSLSNILKKEKFDIVYVPRSLDKTQIEYIRALRASQQDTKFIAGIHVPINIFYIDSAKRYNPDLIFSMADAVHLISNAPKNIELIPKEYRDKIEVIENLVKEERIAFDQESFRLRILSAGRLSVEKNFNLLVQLAYKFKINKKDIGITIYGDGPEKNKLIRLSKIFGVQDFIVFKKHSDEWQKNIRYGDVFVCSSYYEGYGMALAEAVAAGIPGIAFDFTQGPCSILNGKNGILLSGQPTVEKLYSAVLKLEDRQKYDELFRQNGDKFDNERILEKWKGLFNRISLKRNSEISKFRDCNLIDEQDLTLGKIKVLKVVE